MIKATETIVWEIVVKNLHSSVKFDPQTDTDTNLYDMGLDSLKSVALIVALERHFHISFPAESLQMETFKNVRTIVEKINKLLVNK